MTAIYISWSKDCLQSHTFLGLLAKIKCSICSYQFNIWYAVIYSFDIKCIFQGGDPIAALA